LLAPRRRATGWAAGYGIDDVRKIDVALVA
jgi:hypothetical protein